MSFADVNNVVDLADMRWAKYERDVLERLDALVAMTKSPDVAVRYLGAVGLLRLRDEVSAKRSPPP